MKLPTSALSKLLKGLTAFLKYDNGRAVTELGWKGIFDNFSAITKIVLGGKTKTGFKMPTMKEFFEKVESGWSLKAMLGTIDDYYVKVPVNRLVGESVALLSTISGAIVGTIYGSRAIAQAVEDGKDAPPAIDPEAGMVDMGERTSGADIALGGPNAGIWWLSDGKHWKSLDGDIVNVKGTQHRDIIRGSDSRDDANIIGGADGDDHLDGGGGNDLLIGGNGHDWIWGGKGDDILSGGTGADHLDGGEGEDFADYSGSSDDVLVDLEWGIAEGGDAQGDTLTNIEHLAGSNHNDRLLGNGADNILAGGKGNDLLNGRGGDDILLGDEGNDTIYGGDGNDIISGGAGADLMFGEGGSDTLDYSESDAGVIVDLTASTASGGHATGDRIWDFENVIGSEYDDVLTGANGVDNILAGGAGNDQLYGRSGDDVLSGGAGADIIDGGEGSDLADYAGSDTGVTIDLEGGTASGGHAEGDKLTGIEHLVGSDHDDHLRGTDGINMIGGGAGNDAILGGGGDDILSGGDGNDRVEGGDGQDIIFGDAGDDVLIGGAGDDLIDGGAGADRIDGGDGQDTVSYAESDAGVGVVLWTGGARDGHASGDLLLNIEHVIGSAHDDAIVGGWDNNILTGGAGNDRLDGYLGDDVLAGGSGADTLIGGAGEDWADYAGSEQGVAVDLTSGTGAGGDAEGDTLSGIENLAGSAHDDTLTGDGGANKIEGGAGDDRLAGGDGSDSFIFSGEWGQDVIRDFGEGDQIVLDAEAYAQLEIALANATEHGNGLSLDFNGRSITFDNVDRGNLNVDDFRVAP